MAKRQMNLLSPASMTPEIDRTLHALGFEYSHVSPEKVAGRLKVTETCCQPFNVLNGGVSALMAESMSSMGAYIASGFKRVAGVQLSTNHLRPALLGDVVEAEAKPIQLGKSIQVWEVEIRRIDPSGSADKALISSSRTTVLISSAGAPQHMKGYEETLKKLAKL